MHQKKRSFLNKVSSHHKVDELALILREFLKEVHKVHHEYTFEEIKELIGRKHIDDVLKIRVQDLCDLLTHLEYRPRGASKKEIAELKSLLREIIKESIPEEKMEKTESFLDRLQHRAVLREQKKKRHEKIKEKVELAKETVKKKAVSKVKEKKKELNPSEINEVRKFIETSRSLGMKNIELRKELQQMGFQNDVIENALK